MPATAVVLFDCAQPIPEDHNYSDWLADPAWESEKAVGLALKEIGYEPVYMGVHDDIYKMVLDLKALQPKFVFNMAEAFNNDRFFEPHIASVLDLLKIPYTGNDPLALNLCQDKNLCKKILSHHRIRVPKWITSDVIKPLKKIPKFKFPAFVKPSSEEGSEGISKDSFVTNEVTCLERVLYLHEKLKCNVMIEEFIPGREIYVGVIGLKRPEILPARELTFREMPDDVPRFATFKAKWDESYRKKWGIRNEFAENLTEQQQADIKDICRRAFDILTLSGFARFDFRLTEAGQIVLLEVNPNPSLSPEDDFALSAQRAGYTYKEMIQKIVDLALSRSRS